MLTLFFGSVIETNRTLKKKKIQDKKHTIATEMKPNASEEWVTSWKFHLQVLIFWFYTLDSPINKEASPPEIPA